MTKKPEKSGWRYARLQNAQPNQLYLKILPMICLNQLNQNTKARIMNSKKNSVYLLQNGDTASNMKELRSITGRSVTVLRKLIKKGEILKITNEQMLRSYERDTVNNI